jgi:hypothetical protein
MKHAWLAQPTLLLSPGIEFSDSRDLESGVSLAHVSPRLRCTDGQDRRGLS